MLPGHDVWVTDWRDARNVPLEAGKFDLDDYIDYLIAWLDHIGPGAHVLAVCQPSVPCYAAAANMAASKHKCRQPPLPHDGRTIDTTTTPQQGTQQAQTPPHCRVPRNEH